MPFLYVSSADHSSHILCDADENDFASCLTEILGWSSYGGGHATAIAKLRFLSFARQVGSSVAALLAYWN